MSITMTLGTSEFIKELTSLNKEKTLIVVSPTTFKKMYSIEQELISSFHHMFTSSITYEFINSHPDWRNYDVFVGIGGGTAIDYVKYMTFHSGSEEVPKKCIAVPSMLSTNVFATNKVAVVWHMEKKTEQGVLPDTVLLNIPLLQKSSKENLYGLVDVFSIFNALRDWDVAANNKVIPIDEPIYEKAKLLLDQAIKISDTVEIEGTMSEGNILAIHNLVKMAGYITNEYGSGRPESGSEHIFASNIETYLTHLPHALAVTLGMFIMNFIYTKNQYLSDYLNRVVKTHITMEDIPFEKLGIIKQVNALGLSVGQVQFIVNTMLPRKDKFTVLDIVSSKHIDLVALFQYLENKGFEFKKGETCNV